MTFVDGHIIAGIQHNAGATTGNVQRKISLNCQIHSVCVEGLEHDLCHLLAIVLGVQGSFNQEDGMLLGSDTQLIVESVMSDLLQLVTIPCSMGYFNVGRQHGEHRHQRNRPCTYWSHCQQPRNQLLRHTISLLFKWIKTKETKKLWRF